MRTRKRDGDKATCRGAHFLGDHAARSQAAFQMSTGGTRPTALGPTGLGALPHKYL